MEWVFLAIGVVVGVALGAWGVARFGKSQAQGTLDILRSQLDEKDREIINLRGLYDGERDKRLPLETKLEESEKRLAEQQRQFEVAVGQLKEAFGNLSREALNANNQSFLELAKTQLETFVTRANNSLGAKQEAIDGVVKPLQETLKEYRRQLRELESSRQEAYGGIKTHLVSVAEAQRQLAGETQSLTQALRRPEVRGRWGEIQLRNVVEMAGMSQHCDFTEQATVGDPSNRLRPDMVVHLPAERVLVVDAKVSCDAFLDAMGADDEQARQAHLERHARQIRTHFQSLAKKEYWSQFERTPEFVVMFIPGESFWFAALEIDKTLIEDGIKNHVLIAPPTNLIGLLLVAAHGWRQERLAESAREISRLGAELHDRLRVFVEHLGDVGQSLTRATDSYNKSVRSLDSRVLVSARRMKELGISGGKEISQPPPVSQVPHVPQAGSGRLL